MYLLEQRRLNAVWEACVDLGEEALKGVDWTRGIVPVDGTKPSSPALRPLASISHVVPLRVPATFCLGSIRSSPNSPAKRSSR